MSNVYSQEEILALAGGDTSATATDTNTATNTATNTIDEETGVVDKTASTSSKKRPDVTRQDIINVLNLKGKAEIVKAAKQELLNKLLLVERVTEIPSRLLREVIKTLKGEEYSMHFSEETITKCLKRGYTSVNLYDLDTLENHINQMVNMDSSLTFGSTVYSSEEKATDSKSKGEAAYADVPLDKLFPAVLQLIHSNKNENDYEYLNTIKYASIPVWEKGKETIINTISLQFAAILSGEDGDEFHRIFSSSSVIRKSQKKEATNKLPSFRKQREAQKSNKG